ncbi:GTPase and tRNA-U34 5-formylation enzyme TrmE [Candidatus Nasuia deltocephalinicola]|uniref:GTPase and tRNA-U34 5-formylation enzyme TrmE n=1 Tax=Candidatus Nasuia deltocephalincola TaxID=1160784 RepID=A0A0S2UP26_9PROT|nr:GTPase and tRNA-U34 5-formylation enzyme TrmE [Candidatus Nasuia deltocephalinicola]
MFLRKPILNTSTGRCGAIGVIKISFGYINKKILYFIFKKVFYKKIKNKFINYCFIYDYKNFLIDKIIVLYFEKPNSYTGEDIIELHCHCNNYILKFIIDNFLKILKIYGIRLSKRGEFTKRGFLNNKIDIFELEIISNIINFYGNFFLKNIDINLKKILFFIYKLSKNLILQFENKLLSNKKNFYYYLIYIKNKIFFVLKNIKLFKNNNNSIIILGFSNSGKSTFINNFSSNNLSIISSTKGTTKNLIKKIVNIDNLFFKIFDTPGVINFKNSIEYLNILFVIKKKNYSKIIFYIFDSFIIYNTFFYYIRKKIKKQQIIINILNKIDKIGKKFSLEIFINIYYIKNIKIKISSKNKYGLNLIKSEIKRINFKNINNTRNIFHKIIKKSYKNINKSYIFFLKKKYLFFKNSFYKFLKNINLIIFKKNKIFFNKIFKKFCLGK